MNLILHNNASGVTSLTLLLFLTNGSLFAQGTAVSEQEDIAQISLPDPAFDDEEFAADYEPDEVDRLPDVAESPEGRLQRLFTLYRDAVNEGMYEEADTIAKQIVELAIELNGLDSAVTARAITNLAIAQHGAEDYRSAELNFKAAIDIIERISDRLNEDLINPLKGLAATELAQGKPVKAAETYQRAMHISHVNFGPHNLDQIELLESLAETYLSGGEFKEAEQMQRRMFALQVRNFSGNSEELLPALLNQARWMKRLGLYDKERSTWRRVISILESNRGKNDLSLIPPLTGLGQSYLYINADGPIYYQPGSVTTGEIYLKRAARIAENNPQADWKIRSQTKVELGDYYILTNNANRGWAMYRDAWEILSADESRHGYREEALQSLSVISDIAPPKIYGLNSGSQPSRRSGGFEIGRLVYHYTINTRGKVADIELVEADPQGMGDMERKVRRELRTLMRRPKMLDGNAVPAIDLTYTHEYYYRPSDLSDPEPEMDEPAN